MEIIPAIDLLDGRCVRLYQGDFARVTAYDSDPLALAAAYREACAQRLHVVDLDGARTGAPVNDALIRELAAGSGLALQAGGGVRTRERAESLLAAGVERVVVGSTAISDPGEVTTWLDAHGPERLVLAFDVRVDAAGEPMVLTHGWRAASGKTLWELMELYLAAGARHFLCTDVARDGTLAGPNVELYRECVRRYPHARLIASGGLSCAGDLPALADTGVAAVVTGKALLDGRLTLEEMRQFSLAG
jgi:phosphoribosylformimino-5-aminoimidazole carboxamide ribotide isomerase